MADSAVPSFVVRVVVEVTETFASGAPFISVAFVPFGIVTVTYPIGDSMITVSFVLLLTGSIGS